MFRMVPFLMISLGDFLMTIYNKISCLRQNIHDIYVRAVDLSLIGETILNWDDEYIELYHTKRLEVDTLLYQFSSVYPSECIDSICLLLAEKEKLLYGIMQVLNEQEESKCRS